MPGGDLGYIGNLKTSSYVGTSANLGGNASLSRPGNDPRIRVTDDASSSSHTVVASARGAPTVPEVAKGASAASDAFDASAIYAEMQWVFATATGTLQGRSKWNDRSSTPVTVAKGGETVLLVYPMRRHKHHNLDEYLMRAKTVDATTGQLNMCWCVIHEVALKESGDVERSTRHVRNFRFAK